MPVAIPAATMAVSVGASIFQKSAAKKRERKAQNAISEYKRQEIQNPFENTQISTVGADRQREDIARAMATNANYAAMGGSRAIAAMSPELIAQQNNQEAQIAANLDQQEAQRQNLIAQGAVNAQNMMEQRENNDLLGLGNELSIAQNQSQQASNNLTQSIVQGAFSVGTGMAGAGMFGKSAPTGGATGNLNLGTNLSSNGLTLPAVATQNPAIGGFSFGNNINGFQFNNPSVFPPLNFKLR